MSGLILAAPASGSGKTTITLGLLRALKNKGVDIRSAKSGPDYIDPQFHAAATGKPCPNLDAWAMSPEKLKTLAAGEGYLIIEGAMGLFDGAPPDGQGATADLATHLGLSVVLVVNAQSMSHSIAALVSGFAHHKNDVKIAGVILNSVGSERHSAMLKSALAPLNIPVLGAVPRDVNLARPSRHLGLVQAGEMPDLEDFVSTAAGIVERHVNLDALCALMTPLPAAISGKHEQTIPPKRIAIARDAAFSFVYPHQIAHWKAANCEINYFSPLANDPVPETDFVFLPGGYPELHAARLASSLTFLQSLKEASQTTEVYGECGGYMTLGETLIDADGTAHKMSGLLGLTTSFQDRKLHLGYRTLAPYSAEPTDVLNQTLAKGHEFHYATTVEAEGKPLFLAQDAEGRDLGAMGLIEGHVSGSFAHVIEYHGHPIIADSDGQA